MSTFRGTTLKGRDRIDRLGEMFEFFWLVLKRLTVGGAGARFFGETLRQAGILITGSVLIIAGLVFVLGLQCGIEGAYGAAAVGAPSVAGAFTALCDLREITPYAFGYMMAAKVGTGIVAELGSMRISDEIDALDVMGLDSVGYLCCTRLLGMWLIIPFVYVASLSVGYTGSYVAVVQQIAHVSPGGYLQLFWTFQSPIDLLYSAVKAMAMATFIVLVACYYGYHAYGGPVEVGRATAKSMAVNLLGIHAIGLLGTQLFWGHDMHSPIGG
jgi:phospholipid/cholesterol/gamma-HCH transport system permease protein